MKRRSILVAVLGVLCVFFGCVTSFVQSFAHDVDTSLENAEIIKEKYDSFKELMESLNGEREVLYEEVINHLFVEDVESSYSFWFESYQDYENTIKSVESYKDMLQERCLDIIYTDSNIQSKCDSMLISYETTINYYVKDVNKFNKFLNLYNEEVTEENKIILFDLKKYNYIDFNDDGNYIGK